MEIYEFVSFSCSYAQDFSAGPVSSKAEHSQELCEGSGKQHEPNLLQPSRTSETLSTGNLLLAPEYSVITIFSNPEEFIDSQCSRFTVDYSI